ncbi:MAG: bifunctional adenosylcobinamide kinase/adenosylcobinamide-phosphate guanylyltransferase [Lysinibacillus sp.]
MPLIFITGGVRSGKSAFAESTARTLFHNELQDEKRLVYVASGVATDSEMTKRIMKHQRDREQQSIEWHTIEAPVDLHAACMHIKAGDIVLWDCVTTWLTNAFYEGFEQGNPCIAHSGCIEQKITEVQQEITTLLTKNVQLIIVSNELFDEPTYVNDEVEKYRKLLGEIHQWFVTTAQQAFEMDYGVVKRWK